MGQTTTQSVEFVGKETSGANTYETYRAPDAETAREYLASREVLEDLYYIVVETPEGNWGIDKLGLYLERLLPFQTDLAAAECDGETHGIAAIPSLTMAAKGASDNFIITVECGRCGHQWKDGVRYQQPTVVRCPSCKALSKVETAPFLVITS